MSEHCLFCKIIRGDIPSQKVWEDEHCYAFRDINPQTPVHVLVVPRRHVAGLNDTEALPDSELAACLKAARAIAVQEGISESGYRVLTNCGPDACQSVHHLHFHVLGGRKMTEQMG